MRIKFILLLSIIVLVGHACRSRGICSHEGLFLDNVTDYFGTYPKQVDSPYSVAVLDTGVDINVLSEDRIILFKDFVNGKNEAYDDNSHGTNVINIICELTNENLIGYKQDIVVLKTINKYSIVSYKCLLDSLDWLCENYETYNIKVICMAFGFENDDLYNDINIMKKLNYLADKGILFVTSAGNNDKMTFPALCDKVIAIGSIDYNLENEYNAFETVTSRLSSVNKKADKPDFYVPSENIIIENSKGCGHKVISGTSYSAAVVSAQIIFLIQNTNFNSFIEAKEYLESFSDNGILIYRVPDVNQ